MSTTTGDANRRGAVLAVLAGVLVAAALVGLAVVLVNRTNDDVAGSDPALESASDTSSAASDGDSRGVGAGSPDDGDATGPVTTIGAAATIELTTDTIEADDETTDDPTDGDLDPDDGDGRGAGAPDTVPTIPPSTTGTCRITIGRFDGQAGVVELGADGACGALSATIQAVNPRDDQAATDWGRQIRVCQRHPAATAVEVAVTTGGGTVPLTGGLSRTTAEAEADPIEAITITFADQDTPQTGPRPVALCRTDAAELSIVHRPAG